jgi:WD40 repeat protein
LPRSRRFLQGGSAIDQYVAFSPDSTLLLARRSPTRTAVFDTSTWEETAIITASGADDSVLPFRSADRTHLMAIAEKESVVLWDTSTRRTVRRIQAKRGGSLISLGISADARMLAMGYTDDTITLHDGNTGAWLASIRSHLSGVEWVAFSADSKSLATASGRYVKLWHIPTRREMLSLELPSMVISVAFTPDGNGLLTAEMGGITRVWQAPAFNQIRLEKGDAAAGQIPQ